MDFTTKERHNIHYKQSPIVFSDQIIHTIPFAEKKTSPTSKALYNLQEETIKSLISCKELQEISWCIWGVPHIHGYPS
jgi:hypothetical protein